MTSTARSHTWIAMAALGIALGSAAVSVHASAPAGRYTLAASTVLDNATLLTWERNALATAGSWPSATQYCQSLSLGGKTSGWRLPTVSELESLIDWSRYNPATDVAAFPITPTDLFYWSSTTASSGSNQVWEVDFYHGNAQSAASSNLGYRRCVHR